MFPFNPLVKLLAGDLRAAQRHILRKAWPEQPIMMPCLQLRIWFCTPPLGVQFGVVRLGWVQAWHRFNILSFVFNILSIARLWFRLGLGRVPGWLRVGSGWVPGLLTPTFRVAVLEVGHHLRGDNVFSCQMMPHLPWCPGCLVYTQL